MRNILFFSLLSLVCTLGCGGFAGSGSGFNVSGKVTFPDGKSLNQGQVTFTSGRFTGNGDIIGDGTYSISGRVPTGTYKVAVQASTPGGELLVDPKYSKPETSDLVCEVKGPTTFIIKVEPPK